MYTSNFRVHFCNKLVQFKITKNIVCLVKGLYYKKLDSVKYRSVGTVKFS
jgi:hypothetical protein